MQRYFKMTNSEFTDQWLILAVHVNPGFSSENFCKAHEAIEITGAEYDKLNRQFKRTGKMLKAETN